MRNSPGPANGLAADGDAALWVRVRASDETALAELFDRHEPRLFQHALRLLAHREDAKHTVTVAFFELWRKRESVRLVDGSPLPWLVNAVALGARFPERSGRRYRALIERPRAGEQPDSGASDERGVLAAMKRVSAREQSVLVLTVLGGYSEREVADLLGVSEETVRARSVRAQAKLRDEITAWEASWA